MQPKHMFLKFFCIKVMVLFLTIRVCEGLIKLPENVTLAAVFFFGDSIVDQGNNNHIPTYVKADFPPYGKDFPGGIPSGRFGNGKTPADFIAEELGVANLIPAYLDPKLTDQDLLTGVSFASGGCGYDDQTALIALALTMSDQLEKFKEYICKLKATVGEDRASFIIENSIYFVVAGSDDLANTYFTAPFRKLHYDISSYADFIAALASDFIQELYKLGAKRVGVFGIPPIGCLPSQRTLGGGLERACVEDRNEASQLVNAKLSSALSLLKHKLPQSRIVYIDIYNPLLDLIQRPQNNGFEVSDLGCCGTGKIEVIILCNKHSETCPDDTKYVFWDSYHPTEQAYKVIVSSVIKKYISSFL